MKGIGDEYIPFGRPSFGDDEIEAVGDVLRSGWIGMGRITEEFEYSLADYIGANTVVTVNSCTSALHLSLLVSEIGPGDEVICPSFTWCSTANAIIYTGATPVFCDVDPATLSVTSETILEKVSSKTRAVMVVHMGGLAVDVIDLRSRLPEHIVIIEDAAHALPSRYPGGGMVGSSGLLTCFSFYANKNLSTGEGGAIAVGDHETAERLRSLRLHGLNSDAWKRFSHKDAISRINCREIGYKMNYTDLQASIGMVQLRKLSAMQSVRHDIAACYASALSDHPDLFSMQNDILSDRHARHLFPVILSGNISRSRDSLFGTMRSNNIGVAIHYFPLHRMDAYIKYAGDSCLPVTDMLGDQIMTLPIGPCITVPEAEYIVDKFINAACEA